MNTFFEELNEQYQKGNIEYEAYNALFDLAVLAEKTSHMRWVYSGCESQYIGGERVSAECYRCSNCGAEVKDGISFDYCPYCGAKSEEGADC